MTYQSGAAVVPAFLTKLKSLVDADITNDLISWDPNGTSFHIYDGNRLAKEILPLYFKHNNLSSFIRQLNMYGFRKLNRAEAGIAYRLDSDDMEFSHLYFQRDREDLLPLIHRRHTTGGSIQDVVAFRQQHDPEEMEQAGRGKPVMMDDLHQLINMVRHIKTRQEGTEQRLSTLKKENDQLYQTLAELRQKHAKQARVIETLFQFFQSYISDPQQFMRRQQHRILNPSGPSSSASGDQSTASSTSDFDLSKALVATNATSSTGPPLKMPRITTRAGEMDRKKGHGFKVLSSRLGTNGSNSAFQSSSPANLAYSVEYPSADSPDADHTSRINSIQIEEVPMEMDTRSLSPPILPTYRTVRPTTSRVVKLVPGSQRTTIPSVVLRRVPKRPSPSKTSSAPPKSSTRVVDADSTGVIRHDIENMQSELNGVRQVLVTDQNQHPLDEDTISHIFEPLTSPLHNFEGLNVDNVPTTPDIFPWEKDDVFIGGKDPNMIMGNELIPVETLSRSNSIHESEESPSTLGHSLSNPNLLPPSASMAPPQGDIPEFTDDFINCLLADETSGLPLEQPSSILNTPEPGSSKFFYNPNDETN